MNEACEFFSSERGCKERFSSCATWASATCVSVSPRPNFPAEKRRIKPATELQRASRGTTLYVIDEPTIGLHPADVDKLMLQLQALVDAGNTVIVAEHEMRVAAASDGIIDMGPGAGDQGGRVMASGTPLDIAANPASRTAQYLRRLSNSNAAGAAH